MDDLLGHIESETPQYTLFLEARTIPLSEVQITKITAPVKKPTMRGGVYFSNTDILKMTATTNDLTILSSLSGKMLGPNTEFGELEIHAKQSKKTIKMITNLTNMMQNSKKIVLHLTIVESEFV